MREMDHIKPLLWIAAYPKSGSTWLRFFVAHLLEPSRATQESLTAAVARVPTDFGQAGFDQMLGIKLVDLSAREAVILKPRRLEAEARRLQAMREIRVMRTHDAFIDTPLGEPMFPASITRGAIHLVRDPRDIAVSYANYFCCTVDEAIAFMAAPHHCLHFDPDSDVGPQVPITLLDWSRHCHSWSTASADIPVLRLRYEDLVAEPMQTFTQLAHFAGLPSSKDNVARAVEATRFDRLKRRDTQEGFAFRGDGSSFFRAGRVGGWRAVLTPEQVKRITDTHAAVMTELGYDLD